ncbi:hypothetical protein AAK894_11120 [Lachnospiraceae bacterium 46-61]
MKEQQNLQEMIQKDFEYYNIVWTQFYNDKDAMEALFLMLISHYIDKINGFAEDIEVLSAYQKIEQQVEICRKNISLLIERIKLFQQNHYSNDGLLDLYLKQEKEKDIIITEMDFTAVRLSIGMMEGISSIEKEEVIEKLGEIEEICSLPLTRKKKWDKLRQYVVWISGKDVKIAMKLLPLFLKIQ